jgi:hypothetical protein
MMEGANCTIFSFFCFSVSLPQSGCPERPTADSFDGQNFGLWDSLYETMRHCGLAMREIPEPWKPSGKFPADNIGHFTREQEKKKVLLQLP